MKITKPDKSKYYAAVKTPAQKRALASADALGAKAATIENNVKGGSGVAAKAILDENIQRKKAGLIKGNVIK